MTPGVHPAQHSAVTILSRIVPHLHKRGLANETALNKTWREREKLSSSRLSPDAMHESSTARLTARAHLPGDLLEEVGEGVG